MIAKTQKLNGMFNCMAYLDVDTTEVSDYQQVATWKSKNYVDKNAYVLWPMHPAKISFSSTKLGFKIL